MISKSKAKLCVVTLMFLLALLAFVSSASAKTIYVPSDYATIQEAIDAASPGDTVFVYNGTYYEEGGVSIIKEKITLQGEDVNTTIIHGKWTAGEVVYVSGNYVNASGFTVAGSILGGYGIYIEDADNCIISDNIIIEGSFGIYLSGSDNSTVSRNNASGREYGIYLDSSRSCLISDNIANSNWWGICLYSSSDCQLDNNVANSNKYNGIYLYYSSDCQLDNNIANSNQYGIDLAHSSNCKLENNSANSNYGYFGHGFSLYNSSNCNITNNIANLNSHWSGSYGRGIWLSSSSNCNLRSNIANSNDCGIYLASSTTCSITNNIVNSNKGEGISLELSSNNNTIHNNIANSNENGIYSYSSSNNIITNNIADSNDYGIYLTSTSKNNTIIENSISNNEYGMYLDYSGNNEIYHNNFINNNKQAYDHHGFNKWDKGPSIGGNYWSDHVCHGNPSNGTKPYTKIDTDAGAVDNYPFEDPDGWVKVENVFDTGSPVNPYPSIMGNHTGTIKPNHTVIATKLYTYPCEGTGGHTEYAKIWNSTWNVTATWNGYVGDWKNITFDRTVVLLANETYNYTIRTGSYPQIHHTGALQTNNGWISCTQFVDANGKAYTDWIPAIRLE